MDKCVLTEKEKMQKGLLYNANYDEEILQERIICKDLCYELNNIRPSDIEKRNKLIRKILGKVKDGFFIT